MAMVPPEHGELVSGVLVKRNFNYHIMAPKDLSGMLAFSLYYIQLRLLFVVLLKVLGCFAIHMHYIQLEFEECQ